MPKVVLQLPLTTTIPDKAGAFSINIVTGISFLPTPTFPCYQHKKDLLLPSPILTQGASLLVTIRHYHSYHRTKHSSTITISFTVSFCLPQHFLPPANAENETSPRLLQPPPTPANTLPTPAEGTSGCGRQRPGRSHRRGTLTITPLIKIRHNLEASSQCRRSSWDEAAEAGQPGSQGCRQGLYPAVRLSIIF